MSGTTLDATSESTTTYRVSNSEELQEALAKANGGETILLEGGDWGGLGLSDFNPASTVTIKSADPDNPASVSALYVGNSSNVVLDSITFDYDYKEGDPNYVKPFKVLNSENITISNSVFDGDNASGTGTKADGYGNAFGLFVDDSTGITLTNTEMYDFYRGAVFVETDGLTVTNNDVHNMASDGLDFAEVTDVLIEGNHLHDFDAHPDTKSHLDMIQFWTSGTDEPTKNVVIQNNILDQADGNPTQSIFIRNEVVDSLGGGEDMYYQNLTIQNNLIINSHLHGITVGETDGLVIANNTLVSKEDTPSSIEVPAINIRQSAVNVTVTDNITETKISLNEDTQVASDNTVIQTNNPYGENYAGDVFANYFSDTMSLKDLVVVSDELSDSAGADLSGVGFDGFVSADVGTGREANSVSYQLEDYQTDGATSVEWTFSDGGTASGAAVEHAFSGYGKQSATATITYESGEQVVLEKSVILESPNYLDLDISGGVAVDNTSEANTISLGENVAVETIDGQEGLVLNGDKVKVGASQDFFVNSKYSVSFDIAFNSETGAGGRVLNFSSSFVVFMTPTSLNVALTTDQGSTWIKSSFPQLTADEWNDVTFTFNGETGVAAVYLNGELLKEVTGLEGQVQIGSTSHSLLLGDPYSDKDLGVAISDLSFVGYDLTKEEVASGVTVLAESDLGGDSGGSDTGDNTSGDVTDDNEIPVIDEDDRTENGEFGTDGNDTMFAGSSDGQYVDGKAGDDVIATYGGDDIVVGGAGADTLIAGSGNDTIIVDYDDKRIDGGEGFDKLQFDESLDQVDMRLLSAYVQGVEGIDIDNDADQQLIVDHGDAGKLDSSDGLFIFANQGDTVVIDDSESFLSVRYDGQMEIDGDMFNVLISTRYKEDRVFYVDADASVYDADGHLLTPLDSDMII